MVVNRAISAVRVRFKSDSSFWRLVPEQETASSRARTLYCQLDDDVAPLLLQADYHQYINTELYYRQKHGHPLKKITDNVLVHSAIRIGFQFEFVIYPAPRQTSEKASEHIFTHPLPLFRLVYLPRNIFFLFHQCENTAQK